MKSLPVGVSKVPLLVVFTASSFDEFRVVSVISVVVSFPWFSVGSVRFHLAYTQTKFKQNE